MLVEGLGRTTGSDSQMEVSFRSIQAGSVSILIMVISCDVLG